MKEHDCKFKVCADFERENSQRKKNKSRANKPREKGQKGPVLSALN